MRYLIAWALRCVPACLAMPALGQSPTGKAIVAPAGFVPAQAMAYDAGGGVAQTIDLLHPLPITGGITCTVVTGDQAFAVGSVQGCTMTTTGRIKVGLSSAAQEGAPVASYSDLAGGLGADGFQHALRLDALNRLLAMDANNASYTPGVSSTAATGTFNSVPGTAAPTRAVKLDAATSTGTCQVTLTAANGNAVLQTQTGLNRYDAFAVSSWSGLTTGCTIQGLY